MVQFLDGKTNNQLMFCYKYFIVFLLIFNSSLNVTMQQIKSKYIFIFFLLIFGVRFNLDVLLVSIFYIPIFLVSVDLHMHVLFGFTQKGVKPPCKSYNRKYSNLSLKICCTTIWHLLQQQHVF